MFQKQGQNIHSHSHSWKFGSKGVILNTILHSFPFPGGQLDRLSLNNQQFHSPAYKNKEGYSEHENIWKVINGITLLV